MYNDNPVSIFIVEDNKLFALALKIDIETVFAYIPLNIQLFETGETCMDKFKEKNAQVVILDYHLNSKYPDAVNGIKVLDWIKNENKESLVIMLTANDHIEIAVKAFQHGASDYVVKTDTKFSKIAFSLLNCLNIINAKRDAVKYLRELNEYKQNSK